MNLGRGTRPARYVGIVAGLLGLSVEKICLGRNEFELGSWRLGRLLQSCVEGLRSRLTLRGGKEDERRVLSVVWVVSVWKSGLRAGMLRIVSEMLVLFAEM